MAGAKEEDGGNAQEASELETATWLVIIPTKELIEAMKVLFVVFRCGVRKARTRFTYNNISCD